MRILDMFCGGGVGAIGYKLALPGANIVGWDIRDMSGIYPFEFHQGDVLGLDYEYLTGFDFIHASPPCQRYSKATPRARRDDHPDLIRQTLLLCAAAGLPYVVENVEGSGALLKPTIRISLNGKRRYFNCSFETPTSRNISAGSNVSLFGNAYVSTAAIRGAWGIPGEYRTIRRVDIRQGIPPIMTEYLMRLYMSSSCS